VIADCGFANGAWLSFVLFGKIRSREVLVYNNRWRSLSFVFMLLQPLPVLKEGPRTALLFQAWGFNISALIALSLTPVAPAPRPAALHRSAIRGKIRQYRNNRKYVVQDVMEGHHVIVDSDARFHELRAFIPECRG
jgi:hypothetical protein